MNNYLFRFHDPQHFPVSPTHICGLPSTTFQGILQNISTRIQLYSLSQNNTYNQRSVSTLAVESFFSDLSQVTYTTSGIPMAANVPRYLAWMSQLNKIKDDPTKLVYFTLNFCLNEVDIKYIILEMNKNLLDILVNLMFSRHLSMRTTEKTTYPSYPADKLNNESADTVQDDGFQPHDFDKASNHPLAKKWRKDNVSYGDGPL